MLNLVPLIVGPVIWWLVSENNARANEAEKRADKAEKKTRKILADCIVKVEKMSEESKKVLNKLMKDRRLIKKQLTLLKKEKSKNINKINELQDKIKNLSVQIKKRKKGKK